MLPYNFKLCLVKPLKVLFFKILELTKGFLKIFYRKQPSSLKNPSISV